MLRRGDYIAIEGPIGVGKTSLAHALADRLNARLVLEDATENPFLARFYEEPDKYAFPAQLYFLLTRYRQQRDLAQQDLFNRITVADYLFDKDRIFASINLGPEELALYGQVYRLLNAAMVKPSLVIYLTARVEVLIHRLRLRKHDFERHINSAYMEQVAGAYRDFFFYYDESPLLVVDSSEIDFVADEADLTDLIREVQSAGHGVQHFVPRKR